MHPLRLVRAVLLATTLSVVGANSFASTLAYWRMEGDGTNTPLVWTIEASIRSTDLTGNRTFIGRDSNGVATNTVTVKSELGVVSNPGASSSWAPLYFQHRAGRLWTLNVSG